MWRASLLRGFFFFFQPMGNELGNYSWGSFDSKKDVKHYDEWRLLLHSFDEI